ncbi:IclR family transcriptional regulator [Aquibacillus albus]|uniref:DNA-binding IclR family transcriptional regulator n=1 Tax=Aquibacillus albus TaxID=1168171 RepID=A0ABS2N4R0_9BACI|nr:IclR family transcriptional regulator [Aquibacillus albus]MBM7573038.1 DNA-binding IclR family transcriptional regulator [Aquibacillus albus]
MNVIEKTLTVLKAFTEIQPLWGVNELSRNLNLPASTLHRILKILREDGILEVTDTGKYKLGPEMFRLSSIVYSQIDIKNLAKPHLELLSTDVDESVYLAQYFPQHKRLSFIYGSQSKHALQYVLELGILQPIHIAASGKAILAFLDNSEIESVFDHEGLTEDQRIETLKELTEIKEQGYAMTRSERLKSALGFGAPIFDATQKVVGSIICAIPIHHYEEKNKDLIVEKIIESAKNISHTLGYNPVK